MSWTSGQLVQGRSLLLAPKDSLVSFDSNGRRLSTPRLPHGTGHPERETDPLGKESQQGCSQGTGGVEFPRQLGKSGPSREPSVKFKLRGLVRPAGHSHFRSGARNKTDGFKATPSGRDACFQPARVARSARSRKRSPTGVPGTHARPPVPTRGAGLSEQERAGEARKAPRLPADSRGGTCRRHGSAPTTGMAGPVKIVCPRVSVPKPRFSRGAEKDKILSPL